MDARHPDLDNEPGFGAAPLVEATARIVAVNRELAGLELEPGTSCGSCAATTAFGARGIGNTSARAGLSNRFPEVNFESHKIGIFGKLAPSKRYLPMATVSSFIARSRLIQRP